MFTIRLAVHPLPLPHDSLSSSLSPQGLFTLSSCITTGQTTTWRTRSHFHTVISRRVGEWAFFSLFRGSAWVRFPFFVWIFFFPPPSRGFMCNEFRIQLWSLWKLRLIFMTDILYIYVMRMCLRHVCEDGYVAVMYSGPCLETSAQHLPPEVTCSLNRSHVLAHHPHMQGMCSHCTLLPFHSHLQPL